MKLMDEVAGIVAARHCKTNIVTASVDAINFHDKIRKGKRALPTRMRGSSSLGSLGHFVLTPGVCLRAQEQETTLYFVLYTRARGCYLLI